MIYVPIYRNVLCYIGFQQLLPYLNRQIGDHLTKLQITAMSLILWHGRVDTKDSMTVYQITQNGNIL